MKTVKEEIANNLLFYRKRAKLTQKELADRIGVKNNTISQWENGTNSIDVEVLFNICEVLEVSVSDMYGSYANTSEISLTAEELSIITKIRNLDERGKQAVCDTLDREAEYIKKARPLNEQTDDEVCVLPIAARSGEQVNITTTKGKLAADIKKLVSTDEEDL